MKENEFFIFFQWGDHEGGDISSTMSLARHTATYRDRGHRTPRHNCILEIKQDYGCDSSKLHYDRRGVKIFNCQMRFYS